eukprot:TRINITY_DN13136_c0_g1_i3.p2 TRINITY_DN13136_c0_g1~~TRINITY_DN13136_c0_g1_i3.p2  ORF type:complete len:254 (+),score=-18.50 TRINITY_DN13136_c0_g1_i3:1045-1806(+)
MKNINSKIDRNQLEKAQFIIYMYQQFIVLLQCVCIYKSLYNVKTKVSQLINQQQMYYTKWHTFQRLFKMQIFQRLFKMYYIMWHMFKMLQQQQQILDRVCLLHVISLSVASRSLNKQINKQINKEIIRMKWVYQKLQFMIPFFLPLFCIGSKGQQIGIYQFLERIVFYVHFMCTCTYLLARFTGVYRVINLGASGYSFVCCYISIYICMNVNNIGQFVVVIIRFVIIIGIYGSRSIIMLVFLTRSSYLTRLYN